MNRTKSSTKPDRIFGEPVCNQTEAHPAFKATWVEVCPPAQQSRQSVATKEPLFLRKCGRVNFPRGGAKWMQGQPCRCCLETLLYFRDWYSSLSCVNALQKKHLQLHTFASSCFSVPAWANMLSSCCVSGLVGKDHKEKKSPKFTSMLRACRSRRWLCAWFTNTFSRLT